MGDLIKISEWKANKYKKWFIPPDAKILWSNGEMIVFADHNTTMDCACYWDETEWRNIEDL